MTIFTVIKRVTRDAKLINKIKPPSSHSERAENLPVHIPSQISTINSSLHNFVKPLTCKSADLIT